MLLDKHIIKH